MKFLFPLGMISLLLFVSLSSFAQNDKSKRPSPPATVSQKVGETTITIKYSQPSVKGRTIGVDLEPLPGKVWRAGANEATVFETDKDIVVEGKVLPMGKYGFFILVQDETWTFIFNKTWDQWGAFTYKEADDVLRVPVRGKEVETSSEKLTYKLSADGHLNILWGNKDIGIQLQEKK
jgi:Protein of unknown function (DUF2911)